MIVPQGVADFARTSAETEKMASQQPRKGALRKVADMRAAAQMVKDGTPIAQVARTYGVSRQTVYDWVKRTKHREQWGWGAPASSGVPIDELPKVPVIPDREVPPQEVRGDPALIEAGVPPIVADALSIPIDASPDSWRIIGRRYPLPGMTATQGGVLFEVVSSGTPIPVAAARAGFAEGEPEVWEGRGRDGVEPYKSFMLALHQASSAALIRLGFRQSEGMAGWQGAARQLAALRPDIYAIKDRDKLNDANSLDGLDLDQLMGIVDSQLTRLKGGAKVEVGEDVMPLAVTGVDDDDESATR